MLSEGAIASPSASHAAPDATSGAIAAKHQNRERERTAGHRVEAPHANSLPARQETESELLTIPLVCIVAERA